MIGPSCVHVLFTSAAAKRCRILLKEFSTAAALAAAEWYISGNSSLNERLNMVL
jgi:hypothetical protein